MAADNSGSYYSDECASVSEYGYEDMTPDDIHFASIQDTKVGGDAEGLSHTTYGIKVKLREGQTFRVYRRYRDFEALHGRVRESFRLTAPALVADLPPMPGKSLFGRMKPEVVEARRARFAALIQFLKEREALAPFLCDFLRRDRTNAADSAAQKIQGKILRIKSSVSNKRREAAIPADALRQRAGLCAACRDEANWREEICVHCHRGIGAAMSGQNCRKCNVPASRCFMCSKAGATPVKVCSECANFCLSCEGNVFAYDV